jgi:predicted dehydrogenase
VIREFIGSILANKEPEISGDEGRRALAIILACLKSSETKQFASVEL